MEAEFSTNSFWKFSSDTERNQTGARKRYVVKKELFVLFVLDGEDVTMFKTCWEGCSSKVEVEHTGERRGKSVAEGSERGMVLQEQGDGSAGVGRLEGLEDGGLRSVHLPHCGAWPTQISEPFHCLSGVWVTTAGSSLYPIPLLCLFSLPQLCQSLGPYASPISHLISLLLPFPVSLTLSFLCPAFCHCVFFCSQPLVLHVCTIVFLLFCPGISLILAISGTDLSSSPRT